MEKKPKRDVVQMLLSARRVSTPLVAIETSDQLALGREIFKKITVAEVRAVKGKDKTTKLAWDLIRGIMAVDQEAAAVLEQFGEAKIEATKLDPVLTLTLAKELPPKSLLVIYNAQMFFDSPPVKQAIANLRDPFCEDFRTLVFLGPSFQLPAELGDVMLLEDPLPSDEELGDIVKRLYANTLEREPEPLVRNQAINAGRGLSAFNAEQVYAMSLTKAGLDVESTWERKRAAVNKTKGLKFSRGGPTFAELGGLSSFKEYMTRYMAGPKRPGCVIFLDEVEKTTAGAQSDSSGVSQDFMGTMLSWMENNLHNGMLAVGMPGTGKTAGGMAIGATYDIPTLTLDVGGLKGQYVGNSEQALRDALKVIDSISGESGAFVFATCNKETALPPEFKRRFRAGTWYFSLPTAEEKEGIWQIHQGRYGLPQQSRPNDAGWTGAEIRNVCDIAYSLQCSLVEAARYIVPVAIAAPDTLTALNKAAHGRWLSASYEGTFKKDEEPDKWAATRRAIDVGGEKS